MNRKKLVSQIRKKNSFLCIGLDTDIQKIPKHLLKFEDPIFEFNKQIIEATHDLCVAYKPNLAFYESLGSEGLKSLEKTIEIIPNDIFTIADAKRGDIGNTSTLYARAFLEKMNFDSVTVAPYMGKDSISPFLGFEDKWVIVLALTSNEGSNDFQQLATGGFEVPLYEVVMKKCMEWGTDENMMFVVGATRANDFENVRRIAPNHFFLVPGVGAQGGDLKSIAEIGMNADCGLLINSSRQIIYASNGENFAEKAREEALKLQIEMKSLLQSKNII
jgi:orotidine-5'-phosphate decarboxylase